MLMGFDDCCCPPCDYVKFLPGGQLTGEQFGNEFPAALQIEVNLTSITPEVNGYPPIAGMSLAPADVTAWFAAIAAACNGTHLLHLTRQGMTLGAHIDTAQSLTQIWNETQSRTTTWTLAHRERYPSDMGTSTSGYARFSTELPSVEWVSPLRAQQWSIAPDYFTRLQVTGSSITRLIAQSVGIGTLRVQIHVIPVMWFEEETVDRRGPPTFAPFTREKQTFTGRWAMVSITQTLQCTAGVFPNFIDSWAPVGTATWLTESMAMFRPIFNDFAAPAPSQCTNFLLHPVPVPNLNGFVRAEPTLFGRASPTMFDPTAGVSPWISNVRVIGDYIRRDELTTPSYQPCP